MKFNFDELTQRRGTSSYKWDSSDDAEMLPLWVADMDFRTAPAVTHALMARVEQGIFGYTKVPASYYDAIDDWFTRRHGWHVPPERVIYTIGVVPALSAIIKALTRPGDGVILPLPAYNCFFSSIRNNGCKIVKAPLARIDLEQGFSYQIDFDELERLAAMPENKLYILCNPHNPTGRVWTRDELTRLHDICARNGVRVISDEIHCELVHKGYNYIPYATIDSQAIICCSPSKAFNIAGLQIANIVCPDAGTQQLIDRAINDNEVCDVGPLGVTALQAAYNEGGEWLDELNVYLDENYEWLCSFIARELPEMQVCQSESTYLAWVDVTKIAPSASELEDELKREANVWLNAGGMYGDDGYMRINYACPRARLQEAMHRVADYLNGSKH